MALVSAMACLRWLFHQGVQLRANLIDPLSQLLMLRLVSRGVTLSSEVVQIVRCDFCELPLEGFNSVGELYVIHDGNRILSLLRQQHLPRAARPKKNAPHSSRRYRAAIVQPQAPVFFRHVGALLSPAHNHSGISNSLISHRRLDSAPSIFWRSVLSF